MSVGVLLRQARESVGMSIDELSEQTRIRKSILVDLENDNFNTAGGLAYARGHIRAIAKILGTNADLLVDEFNTMHQNFDRPMIDLLNENNATPAPQKNKKVSFGVLAKAAAFVVALLIIVPTAASYFHSNVKKATKLDTSAPLTSTTSTQNSSTPTTVTAPQVNTNSGTTTVATKTSGVSLVVTANNGSTWLAVTDSSGTAIFSGLLKNGTVKSFDDSQLINVTIGNAGAVDLNVNGQDAGTPGSNGEVVHLQFGPGASSQG